MPLSYPADDTIIILKRYAASAAVIKIAAISLSEHLSCQCAMAMACSHAANSHQFKAAHRFANSGLIRFHEVSAADKGVYWALKQL